MVRQEQLSRIRQILLSEWDALGVGENPKLADEYDRYLPEIVRLVESDCGFAELQQHLARLEEEFGVQLPEQQRANAVRELLRGRSR